MIGPFSIDLYLPAFSAISAEFGASPIAMQQTLSAYLFAYAFMMLWHGALSDALGRRPIIIGGLAVYAFATLGCAIAGNIETLWLFRAAQGLCAGTGLVVGRAIIRDRFQGAAAQRLMAQVTLVFSIAPAIAPIVGGALLNTLGWRSIFWVLLLWVLVLLVWSSRSLPETLPPSHRHTLRPGVLWRNYTSVLAKPEFTMLSLIPTLNFAAFFLYIAAAPVFLVDLLGVSTWGFAWLFVPMIVGIIIVPRCPAAWRDAFPRSEPFAWATRSSPQARLPTS
ncbi:MAG TPA: MFS transporter [Casimicrobiaceae bacterium]